MTERSAPWEQVDWAAAERRSRRWDRLALLAIVAFFTGAVLLTGGFGFWDGAAAWAVVGGVVTIFALAVAVQELHPRIRARQSDNYHVMHALAIHRDPGPGLRERVDRLARWWSAVGWYRWVVPLLAVPFLSAGRWDRPVVAVPGALLVLGAIAACTWWWIRMTTRARRWVSDPPGPAREVPSPGTWERVITGRRLAWAMAALLAGGFVIGLVAVLIERH